MTSTASLYNNWLAWMAENNYATDEQARSCIGLRPSRRHASVRPYVYGRPAGPDKYATPLEMHDNSSLRPSPKMPDTSANEWLEPPKRRNSKGSKALSSLACVVGAPTKDMREADTEEGDIDWLESVSSAAFETEAVDQTQMKQEVAIDTQMKQEVAAVDTNAEERLEPTKRQNYKHITPFSSLACVVGATKDTRDDTEEERSDWFAAGCGALDAEEVDREQTKRITFLELDTTNVPNEKARGLPMEADESQEVLEELQKEEAEKRLLQVLEETEQWLGQKNTKHIKRTIENSLYGKYCGPQEV